MPGIFTGKVYLLVTGASRGIGKSIAKAFSPNLESQSRVLLLARNSTDLEKTSNEIATNGVNASYESIDFSLPSDAGQLREIIDKSLKNEKPENFNQAIIVHCAAMANFSQSTNEMTNLDEWHKCFNLNMFSAAMLNGVFMNTFHSNNVRKYVFNISSYWGLEPDVFVGSYCSAKAAKDMFFKVFAKENPHVNVLNYLPGYVGTDMFHDVLKRSSNENLKEKIKEMINSKTFVTPEQTSNYLLQVVKQQKYESGDYVDFYKKTF
ncbi:hypothetical protein TKK_0009244 [Trichogramma kaykai]